MIDFQAVMADFAIRQAERQASAQLELQHLKNVVIPPLREAGITKVEVRFDGGGDSGAVEECVCFDAGGNAVPCPDDVVEPYSGDQPDESNRDDSRTLPAALESITYLALESYHPGWEINDGACGDLVINVTEASFVLDCQLRYTATHDHSTQL